jgi:glycosyltransferase involved in cell wall biosynthesis
MRIAVDTNGLFTGNAGGARYVRGVLNGLDKLDPPVPYFRLAWPVENLAYRQPARGLKTLYRELWWANLIAPAVLRRERAQVYHATGSFFVSVPAEIKCVVTLYDLAILRNPQRFRRWQRTVEVRRLSRLRAVERVICISRFTADEAMSLLALPANRLEVIYPGADFQPDSGPVPDEKPAFALPNEFFLFVGSLEPGKNLALLKETYRLAEAQGVTLPPLLIVGARWAGVGTEGQPPAGWQYLGRQPDGVLVHLYRHALALVFPSKYEGFGLPVVEAMALGCPVICSHVASLPEAGGKAALWAELRPDAYLAALRELAANHQLRSDLTCAGRIQAAQFTWERCGQSLADVYRDVCGEGVGKVASDQNP